MKVGAAPKRNETESCPGKKRGQEVPQSAIGQRVLPSIGIPRGGRLCRRLPAAKKSARGTVKTASGWGRAPPYSDIPAGAEGKARNAPAAPAATDQEKQPAGVGSAAHPCLKAKENCPCTDYTRAQQRRASAAGAFPRDCRGTGVRPPLAPSPTRQRGLAPPATRARRWPLSEAVVSCRTGGPEYKPQQLRPPYTRSGV